MGASVEFRPQNRDLGIAMREVDEDLAIFLGLRNGHLLVENSQDLFDDSNVPKSETEVAVPYDNFLKLVMESTDYNWLLTQMDTSLLPPEQVHVHVHVHVHVQDSAANPTGSPNGEGIDVKPELENISKESASLSEVADASSAEDQSPSSSSGNRKPTPRLATSTGRSTFPAKLRPSRASTPTSRTTLPSSKPVAAQVRSCTPVRAASRSTTPASKPSIPVTSKSAGRSSTPSRKSTMPLAASGKKAGSAPTVKNSALSRGTSPTLKSRPSKPSEILPKRPASANRARPNTTTAAHLRQKSCSPAKIRDSTTTATAAVAAHKSGRKVLLRSRGYSNNGDDANPIKIGAKMVDRVVNMRKLAPPKQDDYYIDSNQKKSSNGNSGFGRSLSKTSLDMALRHMDIGRSIPNKLRSGIGSESTFTSSCDSSKSSIKEANQLNE